MRSTLFILSVILGGALAFATSARAETPWARDCVTFWGSSIPQEQRTAENCPSGHSHWDRTPASGVAHYGESMTINTTGSLSLNPSTVTVINTPSGSQLIVPRSSGGIYPSAVIRTSK
jgi:hypothetical protein